MLEGSLNITPSYKWIEPCAYLLLHVPHVTCPTQCLPCMPLAHPPSGSALLLPSVSGDCPSATSLSSSSPTVYFPQWLWLWSQTVRSCILSLVCPSSSSGSSSGPGQVAVRAGVRSEGKWWRWGEGARGPRGRLHCLLKLHIMGLLHVPHPTTGSPPCNLSRTV